MSELYAIAARDELWSHGILLESRLEHGEARQEGDVIEARDALDPALLAACDEEMVRLRAALADVGDARVRAVARAASDGERSASLSITMRGVSIVTTPAAAARDAAMLRALVAREPEGELPEPIPIVWRNGSAAVLLHEAVGHAVECGPSVIPSGARDLGGRARQERDGSPRPGPSLDARDDRGRWLRVEDVSPLGTANLFTDPPRALRRTSFRDVPLRRMTSLVATQQGAPFDVPERHVEVHLVAGGSYDALTEAVTIQVAVANLGPTRLAPFTIHTTRERVLQAMRGASGEPVRYPGVVCSREGQELVVGSFAPVMVTDPL